METPAFSWSAIMNMVLRDLLTIERVPWDLIILDEDSGSKTGRPRPAGAQGAEVPLCPGPTERPWKTGWMSLSVVSLSTTGGWAGLSFLSRHRITDEKEGCRGYKNLDVLRANLRPILLRRTRRGSWLICPEATEIRRILPRTNSWRSMTPDCGSFRAIIARSI